MRDTIDMARESGFTDGELAFMGDNFRRFADLVRADQDEKYKWDIHSCGPTCKRYACVAMREAVEAEREACAKVCDDLAPPCGYNLTETSFWDVTSLECAAAIRARGTHDL